MFKPKSFRLKFQVQNFSLKANEHSVNTLSKIRKTEVAKSAIKWIKQDAQVSRMTANIG